MKHGEWHVIFVLICVFRCGICGCDAEGVHSRGRPVHCFTCWVLPPQRFLEASGMIHLSAVPGQPLPCSDDDDDAPRAFGRNT